MATFDTDRWTLRMLRQTDFDGYAEMCADQDCGWRWLDDLVADTRFAWRTLRRSRGFALTAIVTLALGIGVNIGMFSFVDGLLLRPLYANADDEAAPVFHARYWAGPLTGLALLLMLMPLTVLLVACLNLADLLLARGHARRQELAVRSSLGGGGSRLVRQLLTEGLLLAVAGGAIGLWMSTWATKTLMASLRPLLPAAVSLPDVNHRSANESGGSDLHRGRP